MISKLLCLSLLSVAQVGEAIDLVFDKIVCDQSLPAYALENDITLNCNGNNRCTLGDSSIISGNLYYQNLVSNGLVNNTGHASADLSLMTLEYQLFEFLPFNFCGDWIQRAHYNYNECPGDGKYHFEVPYTLPRDQDMTTWFATGWEGTSNLKIYTASNEDATLLASCKLHFMTSVTSQEDEEGWMKQPSAAQTTMALVGIVAAMFLCILCLACRPRRKLPTDEDYSREFRAMPEPKETEVDRMRREDEQASIKQEEVETKAHKYSLQMDYSKV